MNWKLLSALALTVLLIFGAITLPGLLLQSREAALYTEKIDVDVAYSRFESEDTTLIQRLEAAQRYGMRTELDFDAGARLYWGREELVDRFREELRALQAALPSLSGLEYWVETLSAPSQKQEEALQTGYLCVVDSTTGGTYVFAYLYYDLGDTLALTMDPASGKLVSLADPNRLMGSNWDYYALADEYAAYLGLTNSGLWGNPEAVEENKWDYVDTSFFLEDSEKSMGIWLILRQTADVGLVLSAVGDVY